MGWGKAERYAPPLSDTDVVYLLHCITEAPSTKWALRSFCLPPHVPGNNEKIPTASEKTLPLDPASNNASVHETINTRDTSPTVYWVTQHSLPRAPTRSLFIYLLRVILHEPTTLTMR